MSKLLEYGGGDMEIESSEIHFMKSIKQYNRVKTNKKKELFAFHTILQDFKNEMLQSEENEKHEQMQKFNGICKLLSEYDAEWKLFDSHNEQLLKIFETFIKHDQEKFQQLSKKVSQIISHIETFKESLLTSVDVDEKENDRLISTMCGKLQEMHKKYIIQQKKAKLELFVKKLIQEENLF